MSDCDVPLDPQGEADDGDPDRHSNNAANSHDVKRSSISKYGFDAIVLRVRFQCQGLPEFDAQDIALEVLYTFMRKKEEVIFQSPDAYLGAIIRSKIRDYLRRQQRLSRLSIMSISTFLDEHDLDIPDRLGDRLVDPANEIDEKLTCKDFINDLADAIAELPSRQQRAMICTIIEKYNNPEPLILALCQRGINESQMHWPKDQEAKRVLQASLPAARCTIAAILHVDPSQFKHRTRKNDHELPG